MNKTIEVARSPILSGYTPELDTYDEMWVRKGHVKHHWQGFVQAIENLGPEKLERSHQELRRLLRENGVTYNVHGDPQGLQRPWALDLIPFIISQKDWQVIEKGMIQRAHLLNLILADIYGPRKLITQGKLPLELVFNHAGFLRQCDGVQTASAPQLIIYAADLARGPDKRMWVLADRTQAPSGAGYALENRTVMARVLRGMFRDGQIYRLSNFFKELRSALADLIPERKSSPRIVVLTPGPHNETYFEHAYLASYLGYSLVQGEDLTVREGHVWLKSLEGLQQVDVILRRVDDSFCDPLELREDSRLGVAGLLEVARRQNVAIANPLGSGVLENPGLMPFLPGLAKHFLNEDLILPSAASWWCGQPKELEYVLQNIDKLLIKRIFRQAQIRSIFGPQLSKKALQTLRDQIKAQPQFYVGQELVSFSTTPSLINGKFEARHAVLRSFLVGHNQTYTVMPGGLTRSALEKRNVVVSNWAGGISKDTWVLTSQPQKHTSLWLEASRIESAFKSSQFLPSRAAENLFWVGRYAERAEGTARLIRTTLNYFGDDDVIGDEIEAECLRQLLRALTQVTMTYPGFVGEDGAKRLAFPVSELLSVTLDSHRSGSLTANLRGMTRAAYAVRDLWSTDSWRVIDGLDVPWRLLEQESHADLGQVQQEINRLITTLMAFAGLNTESMTHEAGWLLLDIGRRLERGLLTIAFIRSMLGFHYEQSVQHLLLETVLITTENVITYRRRYRSYLQAQTVLDLLFLDETNPRSLAYQLNTLQAHIAKLPRERIAYRLSEEERLILEASTLLRLSDTMALAQTVNDSNVRQNLDEFMGHLSSLLSQISEVITRSYFSHAQISHQLITIQPELLADSLNQIA